MSKSTVKTKTSAGTAKGSDSTVEVVKPKPEWESPILTKLPAMEAGSTTSGSGGDSDVYS